jgi:hypothetical protein
MIKLVETFRVAPRSIIKITKLSEEVQTLEKKDGSVVRCVGAFTFPISVPGVENLNHRIYGHDLFERIIAEKQGEGRYGLCDHASENSPQPDGSTKDTFCVWRNIRFSEDRSLILADCYLFGVDGQRFLDGLEASGIPGFSMVGFGDFLKDGKTIDPTTYILDHPADWVLNPSAQVYGSLDDAIESKQEQTVGDKPLQENIEMSKKLEELQETSFRKQVQFLRKQADSLELPEQIKEYQNLLNFFEEGQAEDLKAEIVTVLEALTEKANVKPDTTTKKPKGSDKEAEDDDEEEPDGDEGKDPDKDSDDDGDDGDEEDDDAKKELVALQTRFEAMAAMCESLRDYATKMGELYEASKANPMTTVTMDEYSEALEAVKQLETANLKLKKRIKAMKDQQFNYVHNGDDPSNLDDPDSLSLPVLTGSHDAGDANDDLAPDNDFNEAEDDDNQWDDGSDVDDPEVALLEPLTHWLPQIAGYYEDMRRINPNMELIKDEIAHCKTLLEAQKLTMKYKDIIEPNLVRSREAKRGITGTTAVSPPRTFAEAKDYADAHKLPRRTGWQ